MSDARNLGETAIVYLCVVNLLRRSCVSDARNLGETAFVRERGQPSAEIVRVGCAKPTYTIALEAVYLFLVKCYLHKLVSSRNK